ncbi:MAG TPA: TIGR03560 family F420-dependent LLM class oxidoreductase [Anaerolineae bacterium]|nr:TIGR03560 family F420-dependent LLM class oxidoreductase [Anaerolineae bacterium]
MRFGIHNPSWLYGSDPYQMFAELKRKAQWAEQHGYTWFSVMDHLIQIPGVGQPEEPFMEGWTVLSALAAVTEKIRLATLVTSVAYRNPALLAKMAAGVDIISGGRLTFGFGAGWYYQEYGQYGYAFPERPAVRIRQMEEALKLIKLMWTEPRATFYGKYFHVDEAILEPKPVQKPHPPIMIGGSGEQLTLRVLARHGDACNLFGDPDTIKHKLDVLRQHCDAEQRDYNSIERTNLIGLLLARTDAELQAKLDRLGVPDPQRSLALTVSQAIDLVGRYQSVGTQLLICRFHRNDWESMELLADEVMPRFK